MAENQKHKVEFLKIFRSVGRHKHRYDVFRDLVVMMACSLHNAISMDEKREEEYLSIIAGYEKTDQEKFTRLFALLITLLDAEPRDVLGELYMELEISSKDKGQFFTPAHVSDLMAQMTYGDTIQALEQDFITLSEPACGAGGMVLSFVKEMISCKHNPVEKLWVQCIDIDRLSALMCYVQLSLWNMPGQILVGDTLRWEMRESWYTPAHYLGLWDGKLARRFASETPHPKEKQENQSMEDPQMQSGENSIQFDFGF